MTIAAANLSDQRVIILARLPVVRAAQRSTGSQVPRLQPVARRQFHLLVLMRAS
jgi:hypothetical protein